ncbi:NAD-dependent epimerase/dehydratase family protein [Aquihabitans daechungensis]|uniref:NAD-dependent epimerase/dehydratase family protein n=1 Tax=Aquihabitans daechungensis TaxID=1052257 RepID=UPI003B9DD982
MTHHLDWYAGRTVLVTGGLGFVGSHLAERLVGLGAVVTIIDASVPGLGANPFNVASFASQAEVVAADLRNRDAITPAVRGQECIFNLAGQISHIDSMTDPRSDLALNCDAHLSLLEAVRETAPEATIVLGSTRQVYGRAERLPVDESHPVRPIDINGVHMHASEQYHLLHGRALGAPCVVLRFTNTYGPRQLMRHQRQGFIPVFVRNAIEDRPIQLYGGGRQIRDATHVDDVVDALLLAGAGAGSVSEHVFNLGGLEPFALRDLATLLVGITGRGEVVEVDWPADLRSIDIGDFTSDWSRIQDQLGWEPRRDLEDGIAEMVKFYVDHGHHYW